MLTKAAIYYTDNRLDGTDIGETCRAQLVRAISGMELITVSLKPISFGRNLVLDAKRGYETMFRQILAGLEATRAELVYLCEHDVLYHPSHFEFPFSFYGVVMYNLNVWHVRASDGHAVGYTAKRTSQASGYREDLVGHYRKRLEIVTRDGFSYRMGFEPGACRSRFHRVDDLTAQTYVAGLPNIDIRHGLNLTPSRWSTEQFRDPATCQGWQEADAVSGWGVTGGRFAEFLAEVRNGLPITSHAGK